MEGGLMKEFFFHQKLDSWMKMPSLKYMVV